MKYIFMLLWYKITLVYWKLSKQMYFGDVREDTETNFPAASKTLTSRRGTVLRKNQED